MTGRTMTCWFIAFYLALGVSWDVFVLSRYGAEATISRVIRDWATATPAVAFALGVLMGHFFWSQR